MWMGLGDIKTILSLPVRKLSDLITMCNMDEVQTLRKDLQGLNMEGGT